MLATAEKLPLCTPSVVMYTNDECQVIKVSLPNTQEGTIQVLRDHGDLVVSSEACDRCYFRRLPLRYQAAREQIRTALHGDVLEICVPNPRRNVPSVPLA